jgi:hypothetical protein
MKKEFHHIGIPTARKQAEEIYLADVKLHITDAGKSEHHIEWLRAEPGCPFPEVMKTTAHVAYTVDDLDAALKGQKVIVAPFEPMPGVRVAFIQEGDAPVEYLQFSK